MSGGAAQGTSQQTPDAQTGADMDIATKQIERECSPLGTQIWERLQDRRDAFRRFTTSDALFTAPQSVYDRQINGLREAEQAWNSFIFA